MTKTKNSIIALFVYATAVFGFAGVRYCSGIGNLVDLLPEEVCQPGYKVVSCNFYTNDSYSGCPEYSYNPNYHIFVGGPDYSGESKFCYNEQSYIKQLLHWKEIVILAFLIVVVIFMAVFAFWPKKDKNSKIASQK